MNNLNMIWLVVIAGIMFVIYILTDIHLFLWWTIAAMGVCIFMSLCLWAIDTWVKDMEKKGLL